MMRFEEDEHGYAGAFITPPIIVFRFGIGVDEALRVGGSGFLGESDAGEEDEGSAFAGFPKAIRTDCFGKISPRSVKR